MRSFHKSCAKSPATHIKTFLWIFIRRVCYFSGFGNSLSFEGHRRNVCLSLFPHNSYSWVNRHVPECVCVWVSVNTRRLHMFHLHLKQSCLYWPKIPLRTAFNLPWQTAEAHTHLRFSGNCFCRRTHTHTHERLPSQFKRAVIQKSANVFTLSGANIVVSETVQSRSEF